jgi:hypothetical protein
MVHLFHKDGEAPRKEGKKMTQTITLAEIIEALSNKSEADQTIFMKQGRGKVVHISDGACRQNNLLCGITYSRGSGRSSYLVALTGYKEMSTSAVCKHCIASVEWHKNAKVGA